MLIGRAHPLDLIVTLRSATLRTTLTDRLKEKGGMKFDEIGLVGVFQLWAFFRD